MHSTATAFSNAFATLAPQVNGACRLTRTPGKSAGIAVLHRLHDDVAGLPFVVRGDLAWPHLARDGHLAVEVVGVRRAEYRDWPAGLRERGRVRRMRMHDAADVRESEEQPPVGRRVRGRVEPALDLRPSRSTTTMSSGVSAV